MNNELIFGMEDIKLIMKSLAQHFGEDCEIVLHDFSQGYDHSVVAIENGHVTNRSIGSSITNNGLETLSQGVDEGQEGLYNYFSTTSDGKIIRSSSALLRSPDGTIRGSICINQDITKYCMVENVLQGITHSQQRQETGELFVQNVDQLLDHYILQSTQRIGRAPSSMNKEEVFSAIEFLESKGVFRITKSGDRICEAFGITKYQLYRHLDTIRGENGSRAATGNISQQ